MEAPSCYNAKIMLLEKLKQVWDRWNSQPQWKFTTSGHDGIEAMYKACEEAKISIECEQFIFGIDETATRFLELFLKKRAEGVNVRLLIDCGGSFGLYNSDWPRRLRESGAEVRFFNVISPWRVGNFTSWYFRSHRKILIIDAKKAFVGGLGIRGDMLRWRDTNLMITGDSVSELAETFDQMYTKTERKVFFRFKKFRTYIKKFRVVTNAPRYRQRSIYWSLIEAIRRAERSISLTTPYFVPDRRFMRVVRLAAHRGVRVRILLPELTDSAWVRRAARWHYSRLLMSGVRIFEYRQDFLHAKTTTIDGSWSSVGSFNLDHLSFLWNYETNIESVDLRFAADLEAHFERDLDNATEILLDEWQERPFYEKFLEFITLPAHSFM